MGDRLRSDMSVIVKVQARLDKALRARWDLDVSPPIR